MLKVNLPILATEIEYPGWKVSLVDNPGFGEAKECISTMADASMKASCAYIYLLPAGSIGGKETMSFYKALNAKDTGIS